MNLRKSLFFICIIATYPFFNLQSQNNEIDSLLRIVQQSGEDTIKVNALLLLGDRLVENPQKQYQYLIQALNLAKELGFNSGIGRSYASLGIHYTNLSEYEKALIFFGKASEIFKDLKFKDLEVAVLGNMGNVYCYQGEFENGLECFLEALDVMYELGNQAWIATAKNNIGSLYTYLEEDSIALEYYNDALKIYQEIGDEKGMSLALGNLGNVYNDQGKHEPAIEVYLQAVALDEKTGNIQQLGINYTNLATAYGRINDKKNAVNYFMKAIDVFKKLENKNGLSMVYLTLAYFYRDIENYSSSRIYLKQSLDISKEIGSKHTQMVIYQELAFLDSVAGNYLSALDNYMKYTDLKDTLFRAEKTEQITEMQIKFDTERKEKENELLKEKNAKNELKNQRKNILIFAIAGVLILMIIISVNVIKTGRMRKQKNKELKEKNFEINQQKEEITTQNEILHQQNLKIEKSHKKITDSISYASRIQEAMLPSKNVIDQFLPENFIYYKPRDIVSGDFYWIKEVRDHLLIAAADCTGHGVPGAFVSMLGMSLLTDIVTDERFSQTNHVLEELRKRVKSSFKQTGSIEEQKDGMDMALCAINLKTEVLQFSGANIPLYHYRNGELTICKPVISPIGISPKEIPFKTVDIPLQTGDMFYMFSDGIIDQFHHLTNQKFKTVGLVKLLDKINGLSMPEQFEEFENFYSEWSVTPENQTDDMLLMGFRIS